MDQRHSSPSLFLPEQGLRDVQFAVSGIGPAATKSVEIDDPALGAYRQPEPKGLWGWNCGAEIGTARPIPGCRRLDRAILIRHKQQAAGGIEDVGERLDHPLPKRWGLGPDGADCFGEPKPFGAVIVTVLEEMLGNLDL